MATPDHRWLSLAEEATCPICLGYFAEPGSLQCGHTFCTPCITRYWEGVVQGGPYPCPQCRDTDPTSTLRPNRHLANIVQILAQGVPPMAPPREGPRVERHLMCTEHEEKLKLFCGEDRTPICVVCRESRGHRNHMVTPIREAAQEYKDKFQSYLDDVKRKLENAVGLQTKEESNLADLEEKFKIQRERITSVFDKVQQSLENEKCRHLSNLEENEKRALQEIREKVIELNKQQASFRDQITEIEAKCQQPDVELLKSGDGPAASQVPREAPYPVTRPLLCYGEVTLDPDTAHRRLVLSEDGRSVRHGDRAQNLPDTPKRYNTAFCVLGRGRLSSGRHYWEVEVGDKTRWDLGVCNKSVSRKGKITLSPKTGYWAVWLRDGEYKALTGPGTLLTPSLPPRVVGLFLDYEAGRLSVYNVTDRSLLFTYSGATFPRTLRPFFYPGRNEDGKNGGALRILPVMEQE